MCRLRDVPFFKDVNEQDLNRLSQKCIWKKYKKNEVVFYEGEESKCLHILLQGNLKVFKTNLDGTEIFLHEFEPINFIAELANFEGIAYPASARFTKDGEMLKINYDVFKNDFLIKPEISLCIIKSFSQKLKIISNILHQETTLRARGKIAHTIIEKNELFRKLKKIQIASMLNITPETLSRTLTQFKKENLIQIDGDKITPIDIEYLQNLYLMK